MAGVGQRGSGPKAGERPCSVKGWKNRNGRTHGWMKWNDRLGKRVGYYDQKVGWRP